MPVLRRTFVHFRHAGFTLLELMLTLAVSSVALSLGINAMQQMINGNHLSTGANAFMSSLILSRSEAIKRNTRITIQRDDAGWEQGWTVFVDQNNSAKWEEGEEIIEKKMPIPGSISLGGNRFVRDYVSYMGNGITATRSGAFQTGTLMFCDRKDIADPYHAKAIVISSTGRPRISNKPEDMWGCAPRKTEVAVAS